MRLLDLTLASPAGNLALDEALLQDAEAAGSDEVLRFWMSPTPFVVVGIGGRVEQEVNLAVCRKQGVPVLRRCSGGGTVVQGPGCLNYALILRLPETGPLNTINGANRTIMERNAAVLSKLIHAPVTIEGHTDLAVEGVKVSGNAQRRMRTHLLFHGTFLLDLDLDLVSRLLPLPPSAPSYRNHRPHRDFLKNLAVPAATLKEALRKAWGATSATREYPVERMNTVVAARYASDAWNFRT